MHGVIEQVGGTLLADTQSVLAAGGRALSMGVASGQPTTLDFERERLRGRRRSIEVSTHFDAGPGPWPDIATLSARVGAGQLDPQVDRRGSWDDIEPAAELLLDRQLQVKAVLDVG